MKDIMPLVFAHAGDTVMVAQLTAANPAESRKITSFGVFPGATIRVLQTTPVFVLGIAFTEFAIDQQIARHIWVQKV